MDSASIGPALPPHLRKEEPPSEPESIGPALPPHLQKKETNSSNLESEYIGPALPSQLQKTKDEDSFHQTEGTEDDVVGPALPPNFARKTPIAPDPPSKKVYGPVIPSETDVNQYSREEDEDDNILGPRRPPTDLNVSVAPQEEEEEDFHKNLYHPRVKSISSTPSSTSVSKEEKKRDEWMTELPSDRNSFAQLVPRTFSKSGKSFKPDDSWTATPGSNSDAKTNKRTQENYKEYLNSNDSSDGSKVRNAGPSLVELHQQQLNKKRKSDSSPAPTFDRERDLTMRQIDPTKRSQMISQAKTLNSNFTPGSSKWI